MIVTIDFETHYSSEYSLSRMSEVDYILDARYQTIMCAIKLGNAPSKIFVGHEAVGNAFSTIPWERVALLSHNMRFDGSIAAWHFGVRPKLYLCTLSMARALTHIAAGGSSLAKVSDYLGLPAKGHEVILARGKRLEDFGADLPNYMAYCLRDNDNCFDIFNKFKPVFPNSEIALVDMFLRMFIEPEVMLDQRALFKHLVEVKAERALAFAKVAHIDRAVFSSNQKFAKLLEDMGVEVPIKKSPTTGLDMPALARNDRGFKELLDDDTQPADVQAVLAARVGAKSTIEETRTETLLNLATREWSNNVTGWCPVPIKYYGAHTGRPSGDGGFNFLNLKRGSPLRSAIVAPKGKRIVHRDSSQIEARMVAWLAGCTKLLIAFAQGRDVYSEFATRVYGRRVTKANVGDRFVGKTSILGLGYGMGVERFMHTLFIGNGGMSLKIDNKESARIVYLYRSEYPEIPTLWNRGAATVNRMIRLGTPHLIGDPIERRSTNLLTELLPEIPATTWTAEAIWMPNGMAIQYPNLRHELVNKPDGSRQMETLYDGGIGRGTVKLFGGKVIENISQGLARIVITDISLRVRAQTGYHPFLNTYDSLDYAVDESEAEAMDNLLEREFEARVAWAPELPLASEGGWGRTLAEAERRVNQ